MCAYVSSTSSVWCLYVCAPWITVILHFQRGKTQACICLFLSLRLLLSHPLRFLCVSEMKTKQSQTWSILSDTQTLPVWSAMSSFLSVYTVMRFWFKCASFSLLRNWFPAYHPYFIIIQNLFLFVTFCYLFVCLSKRHFKTQFY